MKKKNNLPAGQAQKRSKTSDGQPNMLKLPEMLDSLGLKLSEAVYIDSDQEHNTMGQIRLKSG